MSQASDALEALFSPPQGAPAAAPQSDAARQLEALFSNVPSSAGAAARPTSGAFDDIPMANTGSARRGGLFDDIPMAGKRAMSNPFDQFDQTPATSTAPPVVTGANPFDQFDQTPPTASVRTMMPEEMKAMQPQPTVDRGTSIMDKIDAAVRGIADTATFGMADRIAAGLGSLTGIGGTAGDYSGNLARERAIDQADEIKNPGSRIVGQLVGGLTFPVGAAAE